MPLSGMSLKERRWATNLIKSFKNLSARLVNGAHNCAACVNSVANSPHDNGSCPCIESTSWLIHKYYRWICHKLNSNSEALTLFSGKPGEPWQSNQTVTNSF